MTSPSSGSSELNSGSFWSATMGSFGSSIVKGMQEQENPKRLNVVLGYGGTLHGELRSLLIILQRSHMLRLIER
jgi:hypothetical protein